jgi:hypothetical protein
MPGREARNAALHHNAQTNFGHYRGELLAITINKNSHKIKYQKLIKLKL